ncbi:VWA domain-containing protein [Aeromicrobium phragmitis]|uniref:VWA domain-containing protein n=1 Tax=Aeromicrobium phragmitis TaxID=2478914 RepID=A0A3L8PKZ9_9ACTN|nr:VWA domain-containing protein [Aeromicrobium phragmitis]RLV54732.1 VWA domain-containing protein [Aeromicrobium phragmitis]
MKRSSYLAVGVMLLAWSAMAAPAAAEEPQDAAPSDMMLVLDASGSMADAAGGGGGTRIDAAKQALTSVIDELPENQRVGFRVFGASDVAGTDPAACTDSQRVVDLGTDNRDDLRAAVEEYAPVGWTPTSHALREAAADLGDSGRRSIILVSDGEPTCDPDPCEVAGEIASSGVDVRVDVVGLDVSGDARDTLRCIAERAGGTYYDANDAESLTRSLTVTSTRASRPFDLGGTPVEGTTDPAAAPTLTQGRYLDTIPEDEAIHWKVERTVPGSTIHVGAVFRGTGGSLGDAVSVAVLAEAEYGEKQCNGASAYGIGLGARSPINYGATSSWKNTPDDVCNTANELTIRLNRSVGQDIGGAPVEIAVYEEPPFIGGLDSGPPEPPAWTALEPGNATTGVVPGTSNVNAPIVDDGTYALDINPGETQVIGVPLDWGESLQAQLDAQLTDEVRRAAGAGSGIEVSIVNPIRAENSISFWANEPDDWSTGALANTRENGPFRTGAQSYPVHPSQRTVTSVGEKGAQLAGVHYVQVVYNVRGDDANLPYTLTLKRTTTADGAAPGYEDVSELVAPSADFRLAAAADANATQRDGGGEGDNAAATAEEPSDGSPWLAVTIAGVLVIAAAVVVGAIVVRRRQRVG